MGCSRSKVKHSQDNEDGANDALWVSVNEAVAHVVNELGMSEERARKMVNSVNHENKDKVSSKELVDLWKRIKETRDSLRPRFMLFDKNKDGFITIEEALPVLRTLFRGVPDKNLRQMARRYDKDGNGRIDYREFVYFYCNVSAKQEQIHRKFEELDENRSGDLDYDELTQLLVTECALEEHMARSLVDDCDINKDGKISRTEFENLWIMLFNAK